MSKKSDQYIAFGIILISTGVVFITSINPIPGTGMLIIGSIFLILGFNKRGKK